MSLQAATAAGKLAREAEIDVGIVALILENLSLTPRDDYLVPPRGFQPIDLYPWRYNRGLSYLRCPFVLRPANGSSDLVFGRRALLESLHYLLELIETSRLRPVSQVMKDYIGARSAARGKAFNDLVADELAAILGVPVRRRVKRIGRTAIADERGQVSDIDVLGVDVDAKILWAIECKALAPSRTPVEITNELDTLFGDADRLGDIAKHQKVVAWLESHRTEVFGWLGIDHTWRIEGLFVVDDDLYAPYFRQTTVPVIPLRRMKAAMQAASSKTDDPAGFPHGHRPRP
jgi:hypothetical protein